MEEITQLKNDLLELPCIIDRMVSIISNYEMLILENEELKKQCNITAKVSFVKKQDEIITEQSLKIKDLESKLSKPDKSDIPVDIIENEIEAKPVKSTRGRKKKDVVNTEITDTTDTTGTVVITEKTPRKRKSKIATNTANNQVIESVADPAEEPVAEPAAEPVAEPAEEHVVEPIVEPIVEPVVEPVIEPVIEPVVKVAKKKNKSKVEQPQTLNSQPITQPINVQNTVPRPDISEMDIITINKVKYWIYDKYLYQFINDNTYGIFVRECVLGQI